MRFSGQNFVLPLNFEALTYDPTDIENIFGRRWNSIYTLVDINEIDWITSHYLFFLISSHLDH